VPETTLKAQFSRMNRIELAPKEIGEALVAASRRQPPSLMRTSDDALHQHQYDSKPKCWQVFFLPTEDIENHALVTAFCPFTGIVAAGSPPQFRILVFLLYYILF
jgi:hypothetical protein